MDFSTCLPIELIENIFSYLSAEDLAKCSEVSVKWRELANNDSLWRPICKKLSWKDPLALLDIRSSFTNPRYQFVLPQLSERLIPLSDWKSCYCRQKHLSFNWNHKRYVTHLLGYDIRKSMCLSFAPTDTFEGLFLPVMKQVEPSLFEFDVIHINGMLMTLSVLEQNVRIDDISVVCVAGRTIAYVVRNNVLKMVNYQNGVFSVILEYELQSLENEVRLGSLHFIQRFPDIKYFIYMNSNYLIVARRPWYFQVWNCITGDKLGFVEPPLPRSIISAICLDGKQIFFSISQKALNRYEVYKYNIEDRSLTLLRTELQQIYRLLTNGHFLIIVTLCKIFNHRGYKVSIYNLIKRDIEISSLMLRTSRPLDELQILFENDVLFYYNTSRNSIVARLLPSLNIKSECRLSNMEVFSIRCVCQNLLCLRMLVGIQVWDWQKGIRLYTLCEDLIPRQMFNDSVHLILTVGRRVKVLSFW